jgi:hypothetical protein
MVGAQVYTSTSLDWSVLKDPETFKFGAAILGFDAGVAALIDKILSRKKPAQSPATQTFNFYFGQLAPRLNLPFLKKD